MGTTAEKLQAVLNSKASIKTALQNKGLNPTDVLATYASLIDEMTNTADGTALAIDILEGKIAYINGKKITGTIPLKEAATYTPNNKTQRIEPGKYLSGAQTISPVPTESKSATPGREEKGVWPSSGKYLSYVGVEGDENLVSSNIKVGVNIFGVAGTVAPVIFPPMHVWVKKSLELTSASGNIESLNVDSTGKIYVGTGSGLFIIDSAGNRIKQFCNGSVRYCYIDKNGNVYIIADYEGLKKYNSKGTELWTFTDFAGDTGSKFSIAADTLGNVCLGFRDYVQKISSSGTELWRLPFDDGNSGAIAVDNYNAIYYASSNCVCKISSSGEIDWKSYEAFPAIDIAADGQGGVYVGTGSGEMLKFESSYGSIVWRFSDSGSWIDYVATDNTSGICYIDYDGTHKLNSSGEKQWDSELSGSTIACDDTGGVYLGYGDSVTKLGDPAGVLYKKAEPSKALPVYNIDSSQKIAYYK